MPKPYARKTEAGSGGKLGHSNMSHWARTEFIKPEANSMRRQQDKLVVEQELADI